MSAKERIARIAREVASKIAVEQQWLLSQTQMETNQPVQGVVTSVNGPEVKVAMLDGTEVRAQAGKIWKVPGDPCIVYGGKVF